MIDKLQKLEDKLKSLRNQKNEFFKNGKLKEAEEIEEEENEVEQKIEHIKYGFTNDIEFDNVNKLKRMFPDDDSEEGFDWNLEN